MPDNPTLAETLATAARETPRYELPAESTKRKPGRPRKYAEWMPAVARTMRDGTTLRNALMWNRITLTQREIRLLYKNREFKRLYQIERRLYMLSDYGKRPLSNEENFRKNLERVFR